MISIHLLRRTSRLTPSLRRFCVKATKKPELVEKFDTEKDPTNVSKLVFSKLKSLEDAKRDDVLQPKAPKTAEKTTDLKKNPPGENISEQIENASSLSEILRLSEKTLNQRQAMEILSKLSLWTASNKTNAKEFENDHRFKKICQILSGNQQKSQPRPKNQFAFDSNPVVSMVKPTDLEIMLNIAGEEQAIEIAQNLSPSQNVRVLTSLARNKTRNIQVLKTVADNITSHKGTFNLKECSDILFAMTTLNFADEMLLSRLNIEICRALPKNSDKQAVVGSIVTSFGYLKYKESEVLDNLTRWVIDKRNLCRPKDLASLILTLALVNHRSKLETELQTEIIPKISQTELSKNEWLDFVWALSVLGLQQTHHLESILWPEFIENFAIELGKDNIKPANKMKILNINAVAKHLTPDYNGPFIEPQFVGVPMLFEYRKSKKILVNGLLDTLKNLFNSPSFIRTEFDTKMGFVIDAECVLNEKRVPIAINAEHKDVIRIAFMILDFHDVCKGQTKEAAGFSSLAIRLLEATGYRVLAIPYNEFNTSDKVLKRVQYLDSKLKSIVSPSSKKE